jgi:hypothetical protein
MRRHDSNQRNRLFADSPGRNAVIEDDLIRLVKFSQYFRQLQKLMPASDYKAAAAKRAWCHLVHLAE